MGGRNPLAVELELPRRGAGKDAEVMNNDRCPGCGRSGVHTTAGFSHDMPKRGSYRVLSGGCIEMMPGAVEARPARWTEFPDEPGVWLRDDLPTPFVIEEKYLDAFRPPACLGKFWYGPIPEPPEHMKAPRPGGSTEPRREDHDDERA
jgi:hypothetical protein